MSVSSFQAGDEKAQETRIETSQTEVVQDHTSEGGPWKTLAKNPKIILLSVFANLGALMYGYDNLALSLCLSMPACQ